MSLTINIQAKQMGFGTIGPRVVTYLRIIGGPVTNGFLTAFWIDADHQVLEHEGDMLTVAGAQAGGAVALHALRPT
jgi:hypothetical protein